MKRKALALTLILALLFSAVAGAMFIDLATANPAPLFPFPWDGPVMTPPTIVVHSPVQNQTYNSTEVWLNFSIIVKPEYRFQNVTSVYYVVDGGERQNITVHDIDTLFYPSPRTLDFSSNLKLTKGVHNVTVSLEADSYYVAYSASQGFTLPSVVVHAESETVNFTEALVIEVISPENRTYDTSSIPLNFTVNEAVSQITYCLDGKENITIAGNTTLNGLANGIYTLTIYAKDEAGNVGASETMNFTVDVPFPITLVTVASGASIAVVAAGLLVYFKKRKREA